MNNPLGVSPSKENHGITRAKEKNLLTSVGFFLARVVTTNLPFRSSQCTMSRPLFERKLHRGV